MNPIEELKSLQAKLSNIVANVKSTNRDLTDAEITSIEADNARVFELKAQIERGQKSAETMRRIGEVDANTPDSFGGTKSSGFLNASPAALKSAIRSASPQGAKALISAGSSVVPVTIDSDVIYKGRDTPVGILSYLKTVTRYSSVYAYLREKSQTSNAAVVAPGETKPTSDYEVEAVEATLDVIAHLSRPVDIMLLEDQESLERYLVTAMSRGIYEKIGGLVVAALQGTSGVQTVAAGAEPLASIYGGVSAVATLGYTPGLIIMHRTDYDTLVTTRNASGAFDLNIGGTLGSGAWGPSDAIAGVPVLLSPSATPGQAIVLDTNAANISVDGRGIRLDWDASGALFDKNQRKARVETRAHVDVTAPAGIALVDLAA